LIVLAVWTVALAAQAGLVSSLGHSPQFAFALAGSFALYAGMRPSLRELGCTAAIGLTLRVAYGATYRIEPYFGWPVVSALEFFGVAALAMLAWRAIRNRTFTEFGIAAYFPFISILVGFILPVTNRLSPLTFDTHLLAADGATGFQLSFLLGRSIHGHRFLWDLTATVYYALPLAVALLCAGEWRRNPAGVRRLLWLFAAMSVGGFCLYAVCPATGPKYAFASFPLRLPELAGDPLRTLASAGAPRNAIPSLHFSTALLVFWNTRPLRMAGRIAAAVFLAATSFAILALGEHYVIDIVVGLPFSLFFDAAFRVGPSEWRGRAMWCGAALTGAWLVLLRLAANTVTWWPALTCAAFLATVGISIWMWRQVCAAPPVAHSGAFHG
jgi:hypothetical protein